LVTVGLLLKPAVFSSAGGIEPSACLGRIPNSAALTAKDGSTLANWTTKVYGSGAETDFIPASAVARAGDLEALYLGSNVRPKLQATSSEVIGWPSVHLASLRSEKV